MKPNKHLAAIESGMVTKTNVIGIRKALNSEWRVHRGYSPNRIKLAGEELRETMAALHMVRPRVTGELDESGKRLLRSPRYRKRLESVRAIIDNLDHFQLVRFDDIGRGHHIPVYRAVSRQGNGFLFRNVPWQSALAYGVESGPTVESE